MSRIYIDTMTDLIKGMADRHGKNNKITMEFLDGTLVTIGKHIQYMEDEFWVVPRVDAETLQAYFETAKREFVSIHPIKIDPASSLTRPGLENWLTTDRERATTWSYTDRYFAYLGKKGRSSEVMEETRRSSNDIVGKLGDPQSTEAFFVKGLVVGEVQSGKTANFNAVINRSIDSGYKLIIVLSGIMEDLRVQTQDRVELEIVGHGTLEGGNQVGKKGVGKKHRFGIQGDNTVQQIDSVTSLSTDFSKPLLKAGSGLDLKILICKKNVSILRNLINWLGDYLETEDGQHAVPLLILDDEADNASLNNEGAKGREYASKVNGHIRAILAMFQKKSYLGYTASPFANVLQDRNDPATNGWPVKYGKNQEREFRQVDNLFPDDFIVLLASPTNYIGAKQTFETVAEIPKLPVVTPVYDHEDQLPTRLLKASGSPVRDFRTKEDWESNPGHDAPFQTYKEYRRNTRASKRDDSFPASLPKSLKEAVLCFILSIAVRESRKSSQEGSRLYNPHNTMLVHVSRFTAWQNTTVELIKDYRDQVNKRLQNDKPDEVGSIYVELEAVWNRYFSDIVANIREYLVDGYEDGFMAPIVFSAAIRFIPATGEDIEVLGINSTTGQKLAYSEKKPRVIIAVGGNRLSRGFTVEGLTVNYFVRTTNYSDTLLQMGRWFGYRPGYLDCCRIFTTRDSIEKFNSTTRCIEELETEFQKMDDANRSPRNFLIKVKKHPGVLKITRPSILKNAVTVNWSYQDQLEMTTKFDVTKKKIENVWEAFTSQIAPMFESSENREFFKIELEGEAFLKFLEVENNFDETTVRSMTEFIKLCQKKDKLTNWTIAIKRGGNSPKKLSAAESNLPEETGMVIRRGPGSRSEANRDLFLNKREFRATGKSANIVSSPLDLAILLTDKEIEQAGEKFRSDRVEKLIRKGKSTDEAREEAKRINIPERVYRERIPDHQGVLIIYLFDSRYCFREDKDDPAFEEFVKKHKYDSAIPIVGYAIGFPPITPDPGGEYAAGDYSLDDDEYDDGTESADTSVPDDGELA